MQHLKAIETVYNGYKFRSRLEARWAVFFDKIGWPYEYEPEGYELCDGSKYLPDFVCRLDKPVYFEIKPKVRNPDDLKDGVTKWLAFAAHFVSPHQSTCLVFGSPWIDMRAYFASWDEKREMPSIEPDVFIAQCPCCKGPSALILSGDREEVEKVFWSSHKIDQSPYQSARSARFEYGAAVK